MVQHYMYLCLLWCQGDGVILQEQPAARTQGFALVGDSRALGIAVPQTSFRTLSLESQRTCSSFASMEGLKSQLSCRGG